MPKRKPTPITPPKAHERAWHEGSVKEVRPGVFRAWRARVRQADRTTTRPSKTFSSRELAEAWAKGEGQPDVLLLGHWLDRWLALREPRLRPTSIYCYRRHIKLVGDLALRPLAEVTTDELQLRANELLRRYSRSSVANWRGCLSSAFGAAVKRRLRPDNPMAEVSLPRADEKPAKAWSAEEVGALIAEARGAPHETWLWLALGTGGRLGELRALERADIDTRNRVVTFSKSLDEHTDRLGPTKSGKSRVVAIPDEVMPRIVAHLARLSPSETLVFRSAFRKGAYSAVAYQAWIRRLCERTTVTPLSCHATRHTFATLALDAGVPLKEVSEDLGHSDVAITAQIYSHAVKKQQRRAAAKAIGRVLGGSKPTRIRRLGSQNGTRGGG